jgi:hypothetical protein
MKLLSTYYVLTKYKIYTKLTEAEAGCDVMEELYGVLYYDEYTITGYSWNSGK